jgi:hypothetical protein
MNPWNAVQARSMAAFEASDPPSARDAAASSVVSGSSGAGTVKEASLRLKCSVLMK